MTKQLSPVLVVSCPGTSIPEQLAEEIAARLEGIPFAGMEGEVVAVDGCADACATRSLGARGVRATSVGLHELGLAAASALGESGRERLLAEVVERLCRPVAGGLGVQVPRRRPAALTPVEPGEKRAHTDDDFLYAIRALTSPLVGCGAVVPDLPTLAAHVAQALSVSRPTAGARLDRLEAEGLIERGPGKAILLTAAGHRGADRLARRHRVVERMLTDVLGYSVDESHALALQVRGDFDEQMTERLAAQLVPADRCPHGWPFDPDQEHDLLADAVALPAAASGRAVVVALVEDDAGAVGRLVARGVLPDAEIDVDAVRSDLDEASAASVLVRPVLPGV